MKKTIFTFLASILFLSINAQVGSWATKNPLGYDLISREDAGMVSLNNKLYLLGGYNNRGLRNDLLEYNLSKATVKKLSNVGATNPMKGQNLFTVQGKIYSFSSSGSATSVYDTLSNTWTLINNYTPDTDAGFVINDTIFLISINSNTFYSYNIITNTFRQRANTPAINNGRYGIAFDINGKGYFGAGRTYMYDNCTTNDPGCFSNSFYEYDPITNTWATKASLPTSCIGGIGIGYNGKGYAGLGHYYNSISGVSSSSQSFYEYDPILNTWQQKQSFIGTSSINSSIAKIGNELYVFGGSFWNNQYTTDNLYKYSLAANTWQIANDEMGSNRTDASGFYTNGKIYVGGGEDSEYLNDFWEYDVAANQWSAKAKFKSLHYERTAVELNGKGYFIGGYQAAGNSYIDSLLEYNPAANQWTAKASFPGGTRCIMASLKYAGKIYAGMGRGSNGQYQNDFYEYNPITNNWATKASAPVGFTGYKLDYFVLGDTAYFLSSSSTINGYKYSFSSDVWVTYTLPVFMNIANSGDNTNQAFTNNGKGYVVYGTSNQSEKIAEFDPSTGVWKHIMNMPFLQPSQTIIAAQNGVYFSFGIGANNWKELKFNEKVSNQTGLYESVLHNSYGVVCGTGDLSPNAAHSVYDSIGNLFVAVKADNFTTLSTTCFQVNSIDTLLPYRSMTGNFGHGYSENGLFLNKSVLFPANGAIANGGLLRLYYTTSELTKFVQDFNTQYNSNKTIDSIKVFRYWDNSINDHNPLNNTNGSYVIFNPTITNYGIDKYFEIPASSSPSIGGEIYAVLTTTNLVTSMADNIKKLELVVYPNPTNGILNIDLPNVPETELILYTITGQNIISKTSHNKTATIDLSALSNGVYYLQIKNENSIDTKKIILNR